MKKKIENIAHMSRLYDNSFEVDLHLQHMYREKQRNPEVLPGFGTLLTVNAVICSDFFSKNI